MNTVALTMLGLTYANTLGKQFFDIISIDYLTNSECKQDFMSKECYNLEVNLSIASHPTQSKKINLSINHIKNSADELTGILVRVNKPEVIQKLVKRIEGYHAKYSFNDIIGESEPMQQLKRACMEEAFRDLKGKDRKRQPAQPGHPLIARYDGRPHMVAEHQRAG